MSAIQSLLVVLESAEKARDEARTVLENSRQACNAARQQAQSLHDWRQQYQQRWQRQFQQSGGMEILRCYQDFMLRLAEAVTQQDQRVEQAQVFMEHCRLELIERERKVAAVTQLIDRRQMEALTQQRRQEQKSTDEVASRSGRSGSSSLNGGFSRFAPTSY